MEEKIKINQLLKNIFFILAIIFTESRGFLVISCLSQMVNSGINFFNNVFVIDILLTMLTDGISLNKIIFVVIFAMSVNLIKALFDSIRSGVYDEQSIFNIVKNVQKKIYKKIIRIPIKNYYAPEFYDDISFAVDGTVEVVLNTINALSGFAGSITSLILNIRIIALDQNKIQVFFFLAIILISSLLSPVLQSRINKNNYKQKINTQNDVRKMDYIRSIFYQRRYSKELKMMNNSNLFFRLLDISNKRIKRTVKKYGKINFVINCVSQLFLWAPVNISILLYLTYKLIVLKNISIGDFWSSYKSYNFIMNTNIFAIINELYKSAINIEKTRIFLKMNEEEDGKILFSNNDKLEIEFINVYFKYDNSEQYVLKNINLKIRSFEKIAVVGYNGSGKSTFIYLLLGLFSPTKGRILVNGRDIKEYNLKSYREKIGVLFQDFNIYPYSVAENVLMDLTDNIHDYCNVVLEALKICELDEKIACQLNGVDMPMSKMFDERGLVLSGGELQRIAVSRVFVNKNNIINIFDEPTSSIDPVFEIKLNEIINNASNITTIFVTHRLSNIKTVDQIVFFNNGHIIEKGTHVELINKKGDYAKLYNTYKDYYI